MVYETAIPIIERLGYKVKVLQAESDYITLFNTRIQNSKTAERNGKKVGWLLGGMCAANDRLKMRPIREFYKNVGEHEQIIGIAADEPERLQRLKPNSRSLLAENGIIESETYSMCRRYGLLSPIFEERCRGGCWFCPNCSVKEFAALKRQYPELWAELEMLSHDTEIVSKGFKYGRTFDSVNREIDLINSQMSIFDIVDNSGGGYDGAKIDGLD